MSLGEYAQQGQSGGQLSEELLSLLRYRVTSRYYDQPQVVEAVARVMAGARAYVIAWP
jgi:hypothetical protein